ncbi:Peroxisomal membrane protein PEX16 [Blattella germanica]|nr:Peroxisomal membrane protein PEX16 [Blattella germanica]
MSSVLFSLPELCSAYKGWVSQNPHVCGDFESLVRWLSYFIAGRINTGTSNVLSELVYSLSNLLVFLNDRIIYGTRRLDVSGAAEKLKIWLTVLDYSEVFIEVSAKKLWGDKGKWLIVVILQLFKCAGRLILLFHHKENIVQSPPIPPLERKKLGSDNESQSEATQVQVNSVASFSLKHSGRVIRSVTTAPPPSVRTWRPYKPPKNNADEDVPDLKLAGKALAAEVLYVVKPLAHLCSMMAFGRHDWKPWLLSLSMDLTSLKLHHANYEGPVQHLSLRQRREISRRRVALLIYLLRSPFYEHHSRDRVQSLLHSLSASVPLLHILCKPLAQYLPQWQDTYFYVWSN